MGKRGMSVLVLRRRTSLFSFSESSKEYTDKHLGAKKDVLLGAEEEDDLVYEDQNKLISVKVELLAGPGVLGRPGAASGCARVLGCPGAGAGRVRTGRSWKRGRPGWLTNF